jgi:hypothetical protein
MRCIGAICLLASALWAGELSADAWHRAQKEASALARKSGEGQRKYALVDELGAEDSGRAATLVLEIAAASGKRLVSENKALEKANRDFEKINAKLRRKYGRRGAREKRESDSKWVARRDARVRARASVEIETNLQQSLVLIVGAYRTKDAVAALLAKPQVAPGLRAAILEALWHQPDSDVIESVLAFGRDEKLPEGRARVLDWIARRRLKRGYDVAFDALQARETAVVRSAVAALRALDDPRCVAGLVAARKKANGLLADDLEMALHHFTGQKFFGAGAGDMWESWWSANGAAKLKERYPTAKIHAKASAQFYGVPTRSNKIVFVLDRSASMLDPVPQRGTITGKPPPDWVPGANKMEVAQNQLVRTIRGLNPNVEFAVIFYSHDVHVWRKPPELVKATSQNKKDAIEWVMGIKAVGSTRIFDSLARALEYGPGGADTIFLLSDGAPSTLDGRSLMVGDELEAAVTGFFRANRAWRCVVHTIGVGLKQDRELMRRIAKTTGGTYRAVGVK